MHWRCVWAGCVRWCTGLTDGANGAGDGRWAMARVTFDEMGRKFARACAEIGTRVLVDG